MSDTSDVSFGMNTSGASLGRIPPELIDRYLSGSATGHERALVQRWLASRPEHSALLEVLSTMDVRGNPDAGGLSAHQNEDWKMLQESITSDAQDLSKLSTHASVQTRSSTFTPPWRAIALGTVAAALLPFFVIPAVRNYAQTNSKKEPVTYVTKAGEALRAQIATGVVMVMAPGSRSTVTIGKNEDEVQLDGEAVFTIEPDARQVPFVVRTADTETRVLGTRFSVRAFKGERDVRVVVAEGKVSVLRDTVSETLSKGDVVRISSDGKKDLKHGRLAERYMRFTAGRLAFVNSPLDEVAADISRWYNVDVKIADSSLHTEHFTGNFGQQEGLGFVLDALEATMPIKIERKGPAYFLKRSK